ncbi:hypothetical protein ACFWIB_38445 [Streptomyces sp. NPDC127051]|uniref:hypothetical protein n=1 Tax=Streptomyces sp. NPDC127051 TaxID=3347119 RepID=UPI00365E8C81
MLRIAGAAPLSRQTVLGALDEREFRLVQTAMVEAVIGGVLIGTDQFMQDDGDGWRAALSGGRRPGR